jgi:hypothetical protein
MIASMSKQTASALLLVLAILGVAAAIATLLPLAPAGNPTLWGYSSWCPFAPVSTVVLLLAGGVLWVIRQYVRTRLD